MTGTLVPPWYKEQPTSQSGLLVAAFFFGASVAVAAVDSTKAGRQSMRSWRRHHRANAYVIMLWAVISMCIVSSVCSWLFLVAIIPPSIWYFVGMLFTWVIQIQCLLQIMANRLALIMYNPVKERRLKLGLFIIIGLINVSVFCIWIPARLQINSTFIRVNEIWDRIEKALFAVVDMAMNTYFMWLVKSKLVAGGLTQYNLVYKYNLAMVCLSVSLDILLIGLMSLPDDAVYVQVHPLTYLTKLSIEMNMADLIGKVVRRSHQGDASLPMTDTTDGTLQPHLGTDAFDQEWLGSAKNFILPPGSRGRGGGGGDGGGQMHALNLDVLDGKGKAKSSVQEQGVSRSGTQGAQSQRNEDRELKKPRVQDVQEVERNDRSTSGV